MPTDRQRKQRFALQCWDAKKEIWGEVYPDAPIQRQSSPGHFDLVAMAVDLVSLLPYKDAEVWASTMKEMILSEIITDDNEEAAQQ